MSLTRIAAHSFSIATQKIYSSSAQWRILDASVSGTMEIQTATMDIADYLKQGGQTAGHRELWRLLRTLFKETGDTDELIN